MPAPNVETLYDFESILEPAIATVLQNHSIPLPKLQRGSDSLVTPYSTINVKVAGALDHKYPVPIAVGDPVAMPDYYSAICTIGVVTNRTEPEQYLTHSLWRARARISMIDWQRSFAGLLQYHEVDDVSETGTSPTIEASDTLDESSISFKLVFHIRPDAWPASF